MNEDTRPKVEGLEDDNMIFVTPEVSKWQCELFGAASNEGILWRPSRGKHPNIFWRWMQFICFGNRWRKISEGE